MRIFFSLTLFVCSISVWAASPFSATDEDRFARLGALFDNPAATEPRVADILGWWTGRCFYHGNHETPVASIMVTQEVDTSSGSGS